MQSVYNFEIGNLKFNVKFNKLFKLINLHNSNISPTVTCSYTLQDIVTLHKYPYYINCGEIASLNIYSV